MRSGCSDWWVTWLLDESSVCARHCAGAGARARAHTHTHVLSCIVIRLLASQIKIESCSPLLRASQSAEPEEKLWPRFGLRRRRAGNAPPANSLEYFGYHLFGILTNLVSAACGTNTDGGEGGGRASICCDCTLSERAALDRTGAFHDGCLGFSWTCYGLGFSITACPGWEILTAGLKPAYERREGWR